MKTKRVFNYEKSGNSLEDATQKVKAAFLAEMSQWPISEVSLLAHQATKQGAEFFLYFVVEACIDEPVAVIADFWLSQPVYVKEV